MISNILKSNQPYVIVLIMIIGILIWFNSLFSSVAMAIPSDQLSMPFYDIFFGAINKNSQVSVILAFVFVIIQAFLMVQFNKQNIVITNRTYLPAFFYIILTGSFVHMQRMNPVIIGSIFLFFSVRFIFRTYREDYALNKLYLAGFFIALASLFWAPFALFFFLIWISLTILRPFIGREWIVGILGYCTPLLFVFTYYFVFNDDKLATIMMNFFESFKLSYSFHFLNNSYNIFYLFIALLIIISSYVLMLNFQKKKIKNRKFFVINWWIFAIGLISFILFKNIKYEMIYLLAIPVSFLFTDYFYSIKRTWMLDSILLVMFLMIVYIKIIAH